MDQVLHSSATSRGGIGILRNELYVGRLVWNCIRYVKDPQPGRRVSRMNPAAQWIIKDVPHLRLVDDSLWAEVQKRLGSIEAETKPRREACVPHRDSRRAQHFPTGRVFCGVCGGTMGNSGKDYLTCTAASRQGVCTNRRSLKRYHIEELVTDALRTQLMQPEACAEFSTAFQAVCARASKEALGAYASSDRELEKIRRKLDELVEAFTSGIRSTTLQTKLTQFETRQAELEQEAELPFRPPATLPTDLAAAYRQEVNRLSGSTNGADGTGTRELIRNLIQRVIITLVTDGSGTAVELVVEVAAMIAVNANSPGKRKLSGAVGNSFLSLEDGCGDRI